VVSETLGRPLNAVTLRTAVLCAECECVSDSPSDQCRVCGSRSLFNMSRLLGGMPSQRAKLVEAPPRPERTVLEFPSPRPRHRREPAALQLRF